MNYTHLNIKKCWNKNISLFNKKFFFFIHTFSLRFLPWAFGRWSDGTVLQAVGSSIYISLCYFFFYLVYATEVQLLFRDDDWDNEEQENIGALQFRTVFYLFSLRCR